jgi:hypothetical protein
MIPDRWRENLEYANKCPHAVKKKYDQLYTNSEINEAFLRLARLNSGFEYVLCEMILPQQFTAEE